MNPIGKIKIILRYFRQNASPEELKALDKWSDEPANRNQLKDYFKLWLWSAQAKERSPQVDFDDTWKEILNRRNRIRPGMIRFRQTMQYAAVVLILLNLGWWGSRAFYDRGNMTKKQEFLVTADQTANSAITLPDQTQVWLREGSSLRYGSDFRIGSRQVFLEGEAYFEVTRHEEHPFTVKMGHAKIEVLGTKFNVSANQNLYQTTLVDGKVIFQTENGKKYRLLPNQMIELDVNNQQVKIENVNTELYTAWKDGKVIFRDETLGEITDKLERIYHVAFIYKNPDLAQKYRFSGTFHRETSIGEVITMLKLSIPMDVEREERFPDPDKIYLK
jgi:ferric-dicitrate binding protein FerR (iron transport regulator)